MADVITRQELEDAKVDAQTLDDFVNGPSQVLTTRLGSLRKSLALIEDIVLAARGLSSFGQSVVGADVTVQRELHSGMHLLTTDALTLTLAGAAEGFASGEGVAVSNISLTEVLTIALGAAVGTDAPGELGPGETMLLLSDGAGYWRAMFHDVGLVRVTSRTALASAAAGVGRKAYLQEGLRSGSFTCKAGDPPADALQGIYVDSVEVGFFWERDRPDSNVRPEWFGGAPDDATDCSAALQAADGFGPVVLSAGVYRAAATGFNNRVTFLSGAQLRRTGGTLALSGGMDAPVEQVFLDAVYPNVDVHSSLTPEGWVDWFGYDADAIETCHKIFKVNRFGPRDYYASRTVILDQSFREVEGAYGSAEGGGGTRIVLTGAAAADQPVVQVGTLNTAAVLSCARRLNIRRINTIRDGTVNPAVTDRREDAVPGWKIAGWYEGRMDDCFDYGSPIHYRVYGTIGCTLNRCGGVRPAAGASNGHADFYTAFVVGGYATSFGFIGANASITIDNCGTAGGTGTARMGLYLFGYIGDTWVRKFEDSQLEFGIYVDGADASGTMIGGLSAHQDVRITECVLDAHVTNCLTVQKINAGGAVSLDNNYCALNAAGDNILVSDCVGSVSVNSGDNIGHSGLANYGIRVVNSKRTSVSAAVKFKDFRVGLRADTCGQCRLTPTITRASTGGTNGVEVVGVNRSYVAPIVDAEVAAFDYAMTVDSGTHYSEFNLTAINHGCLTTVDAARKLWYNGAGWGGGSTFGTANVASGVLS